MKIGLILCTAFMINTSFAETITYEQPIVNGHAGYVMASDVNHPIDKVLILVRGFDTENNDHPADKLYGLYQYVVDELSPMGWDIVVFDYVDGAIDLKQNADNLARFIELVDVYAEPNYHLAIVGGSMGAIVARTMFVQEDSNMGVDTYVSVDAPHWGVYLSECCDDLAAILFDDYRAGHQMLNGDDLYEEHYGWLRSVETNPDFMAEVIEPMNTCAIALSDGEQGYWKVDWGDRLIHTKFYPVSSYMYKDGFTINLIPYHSAIYMEDYSTTKKERFGYNKYAYNDTYSSYFDETIANPRDRHYGHRYAVEQALQFVLDNY